tara:strand:+ start:650 stop:829 length:180 start_codon:yes stop_codon:yes gene_type:complete
MASQKYLSCKEWLKISQFDPIKTLGVNARTRGITQKKLQNFSLIDKARLWVEEIKLAAS